MTTLRKTAVGSVRGPGLARAVVLLLVLPAVILPGHGEARERWLNQNTDRAATAASLPGESRLRAGEHQFRIGNRKYLLYVPSAYDSGRPLPLVLFFHGGGGHMEQAAADYGWKEQADRKGFIVAFPNGSSRLPRQHLATWNAGECCGYARDKNVDDVGFVKQVLADIARRANVDAEKIFATGMSNGGMMVHRLACEMAQTFRAVAAVAATDNTKSCKPARPVSVLLIHALDDTHVLFNGGAGAEAFRDESKVTEFTSVAETVNRWVARNGTGKTPRRILHVPGAYGDIYTSSQNAAQVQLIVTQTGGHSWPGGKPVRGKKPSQAIVANDVIWEFFMNQAPGEGNMARE